MEFELDQLIFYMRENRPHSAPILARMRVDNLHEDWAHTEAQKGIFTPFGPSRVVYATCHGLVRAEEAFATREEMVASLIGV